MSQPVRFAVLGLVVVFCAGLIWLGVVRYRAEHRAAAVAFADATTADRHDAVRPDAAHQDPVRPEAAAEAAPERPRPQVVVHVAGAVMHPGIYRLEAGARVADAVEAAGGALPDGVSDALNLASHVADGDKIFVPSRREEQTIPVAAQGATKVPVQAESHTNTGSKVNVNAATTAELDRVPGISTRLAGEIVADRAKNGRFKRVDDLTRVKGIGTVTMEQLRQYLTAL